MQRLVWSLGPEHHCRGARKAALSRYPLGCFDPQGTRTRLPIPFRARVWHRKKSEAPSAAAAAPQRGTAHASRQPAGQSGCSRSEDETNGRTLLPSNLGGCDSKPDQELGVAVHDQKRLLACPTTPEFLKRVVSVHFKYFCRCALRPWAPLVCGCRKEFWHHGLLLSEALRRRTRRWSPPHWSY